MDLTALTRRWQLRIVAAAAALSPLLLWRPIADPFGVPKATLALVAAALLITLSTIRAAAERRLLIPRHPVVLASGTFFGAAVVATVFSSNRAISVFGEYEFYAGLLGYGGAIAVAFVVVRVFDDRWLAILCAGMTGAAAMAGLYALIQRAGADPLTWGYNATGFVFSTMGNPNFLAGMLAISTPLGAGLALWAGWSLPWRLGAAIAAAVCLAGAVATTSFQGTAGAAAGLLVVGVGWAAGHLGPIRRHLGVIPLAAAVVVGVTLLTGVALAGVDDLGAAFDQGLDERVLIWEAALELVGSDPVVGNGLDTFGQEFLAVRPAEHAVRFGYTRADQAHNVPLNMFATGGVILGVSYVAFVVTTGLTLVRGLRRTSGDRRVLLSAVGGGWTAYQVQSLVSLDTPTLILWHWILAAAVVVLAADPPFVERLLPGGVPTPPQGTKARRTAQRTPSPNGLVLGAIVIAGVAGAWLASRPLRAELAIERGQSAANDGDIAAAVREVEKATDLAGWRGQYWLARAQIEEAARDVFTAAASGATAARRDQGSPQLAVVAARLNQSYLPREPNPWWDRAIERDPLNPLNLITVATGLTVLEPELAAKLAERALELGGDLPDAWLALGDARRELGDESGARRAYERALEIQPGGQGAERLQELDSQQRENGE